MIEKAHTQNRSTVPSRFEQPPKKGTHNKALRILFTTFFALVGIKSFQNVAYANGLHMSNNIPEIGVIYDPIKNDGFVDLSPILPPELQAEKEISLYSIARLLTSWISEAIDTQLPADQWESFLTKKFEKQGLNVNDNPRVKTGIKRIAAGVQVPNQEINSHPHEELQCVIAVAGFSFINQGLEFETTNPNIAGFPITQAGQLMHKSPGENEVLITGKDNSIGMLRFWAESIKDFQVGDNIVTPIHPYQPHGHIATVIKTGSDHEGRDYVEIFHANFDNDGRPRIDRIYEDDYPHAITASPQGSRQPRVGILRNFENPNLKFSKNQ